MTWLEMLSMTAAAVSALECVAGRLAPMHRAEHRQLYLNGYLCAACICIVSASLTWQGMGNAALDVMALGVAVHLLLTWRDWRTGPPEYTRRDILTGLEPSRIRVDDR